MRICRKADVTVNIVITTVIELIPAIETSEMILAQRITNHKIYSVL